MKLIRIWNNNPSEKQIEEICQYLLDGGIIIAPTDTLYGIMCDALNVKAVEEVCKIKKINSEKTNLSIICNDISMAAEYARIENKIFRLIKENTPGPFTFILKTKSSLPNAFKRRKAVGVRIPDNKIILQIVEKLSQPVLTTSIEFEDEDEAINPELIAERYENQADLAIIAEEGKIESSTIVDCTGDEPEIIRQGLGKLD